MVLVLISLEIKPDFLIPLVKVPPFSMSDNTKFLSFFGRVQNLECQIGEIYLGNYLKNHS